MQHKTDLFLPLKKMIVEKGHIELPAKGCSMFPIINSGNICSFVPVSNLSLQPGEIILFVTEHNQLIGHRFVCSYTHNEQTMLVFKGDSNLLCDDPVEKSRVVGRLVSIRKRKIHILVSSRMMNLWSRVIISIPMMSKILNRIVR